MNLLTHLGLGDHLITYGLVRELETRYGSINLFCKPQNFESLSSMYAGANVKLTVVNDEREAFDIMSKDEYNSLKIGYVSQSETEMDFGHSFYKMANVDFDCRYKYDIKKTDWQLIYAPAEFGDANYLFIHDTEVFKINKHGFRPNQNEAPDITSYCNLIENAKEIHVIESSFKQLIEFLNPKGKLFLHKFDSKSFRVVESKHKWEIIQH